MTNSSRTKSFYLIILLAIIFSCKSEEKIEVKEILRPIRYAKIEKTGSDNDQVLSGTVQASKQSKLSFKIAGTIERLMVKVGDRVRNGQAISSLDAEDYRVSYDQSVAQLKSAETQIQSSETQLVTTRSNYQRMESLYENNSVSLSDYEQAKGSFLTAESQYEAAIAQVTASKKQSEAAANQVKYAILRAPYAGVITEINAEENEIVNSGSPIALISSESAPEVKVGIPEIFISEIVKGQNVEIYLSIFPKITFSGTVSEVGFSAMTGASFPVIIQFDNPNEKIRPGMAATVKFHFHQEGHETQFIVAPVKSIGEGTDGNFAFVLTAENDAYVAQKQKVEIGRLLSTGFEIKSGLQEGELVATAGLKSLLNGTKVKLADN